jgi:biopolymer transport protein ExbB
MNATWDKLVGYLHSMSDEALSIWDKGGWAMILLAITALVVFAMGVHMYLVLREKGFQSVPERTWRRWIDHPNERKGPIGELLDYATNAKTISETGDIFAEVRTREIQPLRRSLRVMRICVAAAPLLGLLGTVTGMLTTFKALGTGSGGDKAMAAIAAGISEALITTETGLVIALPGLFFQHALARMHERYRAFLAHLETVCTQTLYRRLRERKTAA